jgi:hypothetical protein
MFEVTRNVVSDLWPLCQAQEASADSRALVDAFLAHDAAFAAKLKESAMQPLDLTPLRLSPDAERRYLDDARANARMRMGLILFGMFAAGAILVLALKAAIVLTQR